MINNDGDSFFTIVLWTKGVFVMYFNFAIDKTLNGYLIANFDGLARLNCCYEVLVASFQRR